MPNSWLPPIIENKQPFFQSYEEYLEKIYEVFCNELKNNNILFCNQNLKLRFNPITNDKENSFWHLTQESSPDSLDKTEEERLPDLRRMERLIWIAPIIQASSNHNRDKVLIWKSTRPGPLTYLISLLDFSYVVIIEVRSGYCLLRSAYPVRESRKNVLRKEYNKADKLS